MQGVLQVPADGGQQACSALPSPRGSEHKIAQHCQQGFRPGLGRILHGGGAAAAAPTSLVFLSM